jgi:hypothetical protein
MSQSISEGEPFVDAPSLIFKPMGLSLWRIPNWQNAACAHVECCCSTSTGNGWSLWKGMFMNSKSKLLQSLRSYSHFRSHTSTQKACSAHNRQ